MKTKQLIREGLNIVTISETAKVILDVNHWDLFNSPRSLFLQESRMVTIKKIKNGTYLLKNLNK